MRGYRVTWPVVNDLGRVTFSELFDTEEEAEAFAAAKDTPGETVTIEEGDYDLSEWDAGRQIVATETIPDEEDDDDE